MTLAPPPSVMNRMVPPSIQPRSQGGVVVKAIRRIAKVLLKPFGIIVLGLVLFVFLSASTGQATALAIASVVGIVAPFVLKLVPQAGRYMLIITAVVAIAIAIVAELVSGEVRLSDLQATDPGSLYKTIGVTFAVMQFVFAYFKDHPLGPLAVK